MATATAQLNVQPIVQDFSLKDRIYDTLRQAITSMNIYADDAELRRSMGERGRQRAVDSFQWRDISARIRALGGR